MKCFITLCVIMDIIPELYQNRGALEFGVYLKQGKKIY